MMSIDASTRAALWLFACLYLGCSTPPSTATDAGAGESDAAAPGGDTGVPDAGEPDAFVPADAGPLEACLPADGPLRSLGGVVDLLPTDGPGDQGTVGQIGITPDSQTVLFLSDFESPGRTRLYKVPIDGGAVELLSHDGAGSTGTDVESFTIAPNGQTVLYRGDVDVADTRQLYSVPIGGGAHAVLTSSDIEVNLRDLTFTPDGIRVVFIAGHDSPGPHGRLHSVPIDGGTLATLSHEDASTGSTVRDFKVTADGLSVVFLSDTDILDRERLHSAPIDGGAIQTHLPPGATAAAVIGRDFVLSSTEPTAYFVSRAAEGEPAVIYEASLESGTVTDVVSEFGGMLFEFATLFGFTEPGRLFFQATFAELEGSTMFSHTLEGNSLSDLSQGLRAFGDTERQISPDGAHIVFSAEAPDEVRRVYVAPTGNGDPEVLSQNVFETPERRAFTPSVTADSKRVVYLGNPEPDGIPRAYAVCIDGGEPLTLTLDLGPDAQGVVAEVWISEDGRYVLFPRQRTETSTFHLFVADMLTSQVLKVDTNVSNPDLSVDDALISPDSQWIVYTGDQLFDGVKRLYSRPLE